MRTLTASLLLVLIFAPASVLAQNANWSLAFEDDFDRAEIGPDYRLTRGERLEIEDGRLLVVGSGGTAMLQRSFPPDVRVEFECEAWPERPVCDLSTILNSVYLLGFGARGNMANHLKGPNADFTDHDPPFLIEVGKKYRMIAQREGRRITYTVNDTVILDVTSDALLGGQSFDQIGFITWGGMLVDRLRVFVRDEPHPETPNYITALPGLPFERVGGEVRAVAADVPEAAQRALDLLNRGRYEHARQAFEDLEDVTLWLAGMACLYGDPDYYERPCYGRLGNESDFGEFGAFADLWRAQAEAHPDNEVLQAYLPAVESFGRLVFSRSGSYDATILTGLGESGNPFYHKARMFEARYLFWNGKEGGNNVVMERAREQMRELMKTWPENRILNEYAGQPVPWAEELNADVENHPAWAAYLREAYARAIAVMERFCELRQYQNGQFGGGLGDDVEMMRKWVPIAAISNGSTRILDGIASLTEGVYAVCPRGFNEGIDDVEHSAEPTADTFPTMMVLAYGDPRYYEMNLHSARTIHDVMMGIDEKGYPRFKATDIGARGYNPNLIGGGDTGYHARAMKHYFYLAWYGNNDARDWYLRWVDGWRNTTLIDEPNKPAGLIPGTIWYPSGSYYPPNGEVWFSPKAANYYGTLGLGGMINQSFLAAYSLSGDRKYLQPFQLIMDQATYGPYEPGDAEPPSMEWVYPKQAQMAGREVTSLYRMLTGERVYDEYTKRFGTAPQLYDIDQNLDRYLGQFESAARDLRTNLWYWSTEVMSTDRLHLPSVEAIWGAYSGAISTFVDAEVPTMGVTYETPDANFAALVTENHPDRLRVWLYSFWDEPTDINLKLWRLTPGHYLLNQGQIERGEQSFQNRYHWIKPQRVAVLHRADTVTVTLPPKTVWVVDLRLDETVAVPDRAPDLALHRRDVQVGGGRVTVTVHNIGTADAGAFTVRLMQDKDGESKVLASSSVASLPAPANYQPSTVEVVFNVDAGDLPDNWIVQLDPDDAVFELTKSNNRAGG